MINKEAVRKELDRIIEQVNNAKMKVLTVLEKLK